jgi:DNA polymerase (family 10)
MGRRARKFSPAMLLIPGLGPKRVQDICNQLRIATLPQLLDAAKNNKIQCLPGFGSKIEQTIIYAIESYYQQLS